MVKKNLGRQKVAMVKMTNEKHLLVTFSKRRAGVFKKASEISALCGAEVVIIVFSPGKKVYSFGHPSVDIIIDRYLGIETPDTSGTAQMVEAHRNAHIHELSMHLNQRTSQLDDEKKRGEELNQVIKANQQWQKPIEELDLSQLLELKAAMVELKKKVEAEKLAVLNENHQQFYLGSSSSGWMIPGFHENMVVGEYTVPSMIVPPPGYNIDPAQGYSIVNPAEEYIPDPAEEYIVDPIEGYNADPAQGNNTNPAVGDNAKPEGNDTPGSGGGYVIDPQENDILGTSGFGGFNSNPGGNDDLDPLENILKDFEEGFF